MRAFFFLLILACGCVAAFLAGRHRAETSEDTCSPSWIVEVLRTTDARGMTYESLHSAMGEPECNGTVLRWKDDEGRRWLFVDGALAHEVRADGARADGTKEGTP